MVQHYIVIRAHSIFSMLRWRQNRRDFTGVPLPPSKVIRITAKSFCKNTLKKPLASPNRAFTNRLRYMALFLLCQVIHPGDIHPQSEDNIRITKKGSV